VVDKKAMLQYGNLSGPELLERGLYRAAFASALHSGDAEEMRFFMEGYGKASGRLWTSAEELSRVFGVYQVEGVKAKLL
jgi:hypothetical protein